MRCNAKIIKYCYGKNIGKFWQILNSDVSISDTRKIIKDYNNHNVFQIAFCGVCDGNVSIDIELIDEPFFGGSSTVINITTKCSKCKCVSHPEIPTTIYQFTDWVNELIMKRK